MAAGAWGRGFRALRRLGAVVAAVVARAWRRGHRVRPGAPLSAGARPLWLAGPQPSTSGLDAPPAGGSDRGRLPVRAGDSGASPCLANQPEHRQPAAELPGDLLERAGAPGRL